MIMEKKSKKYTELAGRVPPHSFSLVSEPPEQWGGKNGRQLLKMDDVEAIKLIQNTWTLSVIIQTSSLRQIFMGFEDGIGTPWTDGFLHS